MCISNRCQEQRVDVVSGLLSHLTLEFQVNCQTRKIFRQLLILVYVYHRGIQRIRNVFIIIMYPSMHIFTSLSMYASRYPPRTHWVSTNVFVDVARCPCNHLRIHVFTITYPWISNSEYMVWKKKHDPWMYLHDQPRIYSCRHQTYRIIDELAYPSAYQPTYPWT